MNGNDNLIPLVNVTQGGELADEVKRGIEEAIASLQGAEQFCLVTISPAGTAGQQNIDAKVGCTDHGMLTMVVTMLGLLGAERLGASAGNMPPELARAVAQSMGFEVLTRFLREQSAQALAAAEPRTPAQDAGAVN